MAKKKLKVVRGRRGGLQGVRDMPVDIIYEILTHLDPRDLLNLARTSRDFRDLLMRRSSALSWKIARQNVEGLPACPPFLSEPAYANLVFFKYCHNCLKPTQSAVLWEFLVRYCTSCKNSQVKNWSRRGNISLPIDLSYAERNEVFTRVESSNGQSFYHMPQMQEFAINLQQVIHDLDATQNFLEVQKACVKEIREHVAPCLEWDIARSRTRETRLQILRDARLQNVVARLRQKGWEDELDMMDLEDYGPLVDHPGVHVAQELTDNAWSKISASLDALMQEYRMHDYQKVLTARLTDLSVLLNEIYAEPWRTRVTEFKPHFVDIATMAGVQQIIRSSLSEDLEVEDEQEFRALLPSLTAHWQASVAASLRPMLKPFVVSKPGIDMLNLAIAYFDCTNCCSMIAYPDVLAHGCIRREHDVRPRDTDEAQNTMSVYEQIAVNVAKSQKWSSDILRAPPASQMQFIRSLVNRCGLDPDRATRADMDALDVSVYRVTSSLKFTSTWHRAIQNEWDLFRFSYVTELDNVSAYTSDETTARLKAEQEERIKQASYAFWCCSMCTGPAGRRQNWEDMRKHIIEQHEIEEPDAQDHYMYCHPDAW